MKGGEQISENDNFVSLVSNIWEKMQKCRVYRSKPFDSPERSDNKENVMLIDSPVDPVGVTFRF